MDDPYGYDERPENRYEHAPEWASNASCRSGLGHTDQAARPTGSSSRVPTQAALLQVSIHSRSLGGRCFSGCSLRAA
jgi:hypothetical protein